MKSIACFAAAVLVLAFAGASTAAETGPVRFGAAEVYEEFQLTDTGVAVLTLNAVVAETNDTLRGLRNADSRRLGKLGQLIHQCKLMLFQPAGIKAADRAKIPVLVSANYSLYTGVELALAEGEQVGIRVRALGAVDEKSLFTPSLGGKLVAQEAWQNIGEGPAIDLRQLEVNLLKEIDLAADTESLDIVIRFPVFQLEQPVNQWRYNFMLKDFRRALEYSDAHCTPARLARLIGGS